MKYLIVVLALFFGATFAESDHHEHEHHEEEHEHHEDEHGHDHGSSKAIGVGKAMTKVDDNLGFALSNEAMAFMGIEFKNALSKNLELPASALVIGRNEKGFYRLRAGFLKFIPVQGLERKGDVYRVSAPDWKFGDRIVISKVDLVRVADIYSTDDAEYGHSH